MLSQGTDASLLELINGKISGINIDFFAIAENNFDVQLINQFISIEALRTSHPEFLEKLNAESDVDFFALITETLTILKSDYESEESRNNKANILLKMGFLFAMVLASERPLPENSPAFLKPLTLFLKKWNKTFIHNKKLKDLMPIHMFHMPWAPLIQYAATTSSFLFQNNEGAGSSAVQASLFANEKDTRPKSIEKVRDSYRLILMLKIIFSMEMSGLEFYINLLDEFDKQVCFSEPNTALTSLMKNNCKAIGEMKTHLKKREQILRDDPMYSELKNRYNNEHDMPIMAGALTDEQALFAQQYSLVQSMCVACKVQGLFSKSECVLWNGVNDSSTQFVQWLEAMLAPAVDCPSSSFSLT